jgi:hypothetical protein
VTVRVWSRDDPYICLCDDTYRPQLTVAGRLIKSREPAWRMFEQRRRDKACLNWLFSSLAGEYRLGYNHNGDSRKSDAGYPDVHLWTRLRPDGGGGSAYLELKRMGKDPTGVQITTMADLQDATPSRRVYLARPCCLLVGAVDEVMADLAGVPCRYIEGSPDGPLFPFPAASPPDAAAAGGDKSAAGSHTSATAAAAPTRPRAPLFRPPSPPGSDPQPFTPAVGYVVPMPSDPAAIDAMLELERWLRTAGFSPTDVPYPIRVVVGAGTIHVHCRVGLARPGSDLRVWRAGTTAGFPTHLVDVLHAHVLHGPSSTAVEHLAEAARPGAQLP